MRARIRSGLVRGLCAAVIVVVPGSILAQGRGAVTISAGAMEFDASGVGSAAVFAIRGERALTSRWLLGEAGLTFSPIREQGRETDTQLAALEGQVQFQLPISVIRPYVGAGVGLVSYLTNSNGRGWATEAVSASAGLRFDLTPRVGLRADGRVRAWDWNGEGLVNASAEATAGLAVRF